MPVEFNCARCRKPVYEGEEQGESGLYSPGRRFLLCKGCFFEEDAEVESEGTNNLPSRIEQYLRNQPNEI